MTFSISIVMKRLQMVFKTKWNRKSCRKKVVEKLITYCQTCRTMQSNLVLGKKEKKPFQNYFLFCQITFIAFIYHTISMHFRFDGHWNCPGSHPGAAKSGCMSHSMVSSSDTNSSMSSAAKPSLESPLIALMII